MQVIKVSGFEGTAFEREAKKVKVTRIISDVNNWLKIGYKVPHGRKEYTMFLRTGDVK